MVSLMPFFSSSFVLSVVWGNPKFQAEPSRSFHSIRPNPYIPSVPSPLLPACRRRRYCCHRCCCHRCCCRRRCYRPKQNTAGVYGGYVTSQSLTLCELLEAFPSCKPRPGPLLALLPPLPPRYYSVASSQLATPDRVSVAFSVVSFRLPRAGSGIGSGTGSETGSGTGSGTGADGVGGGDGDGGGDGGFVTRLGLCTNWLEGILAPFLLEGGGGMSAAAAAAEGAVSVPVFLKPTKEFLLPASAKWPCVLIGPGTG